jgi:gliding motility-associated-like protein
VPAFFQFTNTAQNQGSVLQWDFGDGTISNEQGVADHFYQEAGCYDVTLTAVAPNGCPNSITYEDMVCAYNIPIAGFIVNDPIQYGDVNEFLFENLTVFGHTYHWDLGDGTTTNAVHPGHIYPIQRNIYNVMLIAYNEAGCSDTAMYSIQVQERLIFYVPNTFTPNGNTRNELFQPIFTSGYDIYSYELMIFNRWGEILFESYNDKVGWDGTYGGVLLPQDTYVWRIRFKLLDDDDYQEYYGHVNLLR